MATEHDQLVACETRYIVGLNTAEKWKAHSVLCVNLIFVCST